MQINSNNQPTHILSTPEELNQQIRQVVQEELSEFSSNFLANQDQAKSNSEDRLLTRNQLADMLGISLTSIWSKMKNGELPFMRLGNKIYFRESEINKILQEGGSYEK
jgi:excisionase family DNA binding protein